MIFSRTQFLRSRESARRAVSPNPTFVKPHCYRVFNVGIVENRVEIV